MYMERNFYSELLRQPEETFEFPKELKEGLLKLLKRSRQIKRVPDERKRQMFEGLEKRVAAFAEFCDLNVKMYIKNELYGCIQFETSYFEVPQWENPGANVFWLFLSMEADRFNITHRDNVFCMEFMFNLFET